MNRKNLEDLLTRCGFELWEHEPWKPHPDAMVDWSSDYDAEVHLLVKTVAQICYDLSEDPKTRKSIRTYFKL
jgi:hypothetical protein